MTNVSTLRNVTADTRQNGTTTPAQRPVALVAWHAVEAVLRHSQTALAHIDLTQPQWWALNNVVRAEHGLTREEIRALDVPYGMGSEVIAQASDALMHRGWLVAGTDGRLTLTDQGRAGFARAQGHMAQVRADLVGDITDEEYAVAVSVLQRVTDNLA
ncbi:MarR family winged helix-turn-helix transcriptional regulator [Streptomyces sp. NPDC051597]|uniref:MarR family winged helix-turn-helix transcriptional regulator n=1 Tax=Streptomyces sp. NPDC051597 TaxID=3155049 RepID=UPI00341EAF77